MAKSGIFKIGVFLIAIDTNPAYNIEFAIRAKIKRKMLFKLNNFAISIPIACGK